MEIRSITNDEGQLIKIVEGYASVFGKVSRKMMDKSGRLFYEIITAGAFDNVLKSNDLDVRMTFEHKQDQVLARTISKTLTLWTDEIGLKYSFTMPNTTLGNDIAEMIERGDIYESSFRFLPDLKSITTSRHPDGLPINHINNILYLADCSLVFNGAYADTDVEMLQRNYEAIQPLNEDVEMLRKKIIHYKRENQ